MEEAVYKTSRELGLIISVMIMLHFAFDGEMLRGVSVMFIGGWYFLISHKYQNKYKTISPGYLFITLNMIIVYIFLASLITDKQIQELNASGLYGWWTNDYYWLYYIVIVCCLLPVSIYLVRNADVQALDDSGLKNNDSVREIVPGIIICIIIYCLMGMENDYIYPLVVLCVIKFVFFRQYIYLALVGGVLLLDGGALILRRYNLIQLLLPMCFIVAYKYKNMNISAVRRYVLFLFFLILGGLYGVVSELVKLNGMGMDYSIIDVLMSINELSDFFIKQFYRIFAIWIKIGGYIIYHVDNNGFFYGLSFIKGFADFFDVDYVSLPILGAIYDKASYAQPGCLAEGYANFGLIGAVIYLWVIFAFMEKMLRNFLRSTDIENYICMIVPFTKILLDGGSLYSAILIWMVCKILFVGKYIFRYKV